MTIHNHVRKVMTSSFSLLMTLVCLSGNSALGNDEEKEARAKMREDIQILLSEDLQTPETVTYLAEHFASVSENVMATEARLTINDWITDSEQVGALKEKGQALVNLVKISQLGDENEKRFTRKILRRLSNLRFKSKQKGTTITGMQVIGSATGSLLESEHRIGIQKRPFTQSMLSQLTLPRGVRLPGPTFLDELQSSSEAPPLDTPRSEEIKNETHRDESSHSLWNTTHEAAWETKLFMSMVAAYGKKPDQALSDFLEIALESNSEAFQDHLVLGIRKLSNKGKTAFFGMLIDIFRRELMRPQTSTPFASESAALPKENPVHPSLALLEAAREVYESSVSLPPEGRLSLLAVASETLRLGLSLRPRLINSLFLHNHDLDSEFWRDGIREHPAPLDLLSSETALSRATPNTTLRVLRFFADLAVLGSNDNEFQGSGIEKYWHRLSNSSLVFVKLLVGIKNGSEQEAKNIIRFAQASRLWLPAEVSEDFERVLTESNVNLETRTRIWEFAAHLPGERVQTLMRSALEKISNKTLLIHAKATIKRQAELTQNISLSLRCQDDLSSKDIPTFH